jgi:gluconolactonase
MDSSTSSTQRQSELPNANRRLLIGVTGLAALAGLSKKSRAAAHGSNGCSGLLPHITPEHSILATGLVAPEGPVAMADGSILVCEMLEGRVSRVTSDGKVTVVARTGGAPNGAAIGPDGACYITNNGGFNSELVNGKLEMRPGLPPGYKSGSIQRIDLKSGEVRTLYTEVSGAILRGPNDLVFDESGGMYFSDLGKMTSDKLDFGAVCWARADGSEIRQLVSRLLTPNGIALSPDGRTLYVALTEKRQILAYEVISPGVLAQDNGQVRRRVVASIGGDLAFDSMKVERDGNLVVGTLQVGCLTVLSPAGEVLDQVFLPDRNVTNLAFGGAAMKTAYVTLTESGRLAAVPWPREGLKLKFQSIS